MQHSCEVGHVDIDDLSAGVAAARLAGLNKVRGQVAIHPLPIAPGFGPPRRAVRETRPVVELEPDLELTVPEAERILAAWHGETVACTGITRLQGGMVNSVFRLDLDRPPHAAVVKLHGVERDDFGAEARALEHLAAMSACPVPRVHLYDGSGELVPYAFLLLEHLPGECLHGAEVEAADREALEVQLAEVLAELHSHTGDRFGPLDGDGPSTWPEIVADRLAGVRSHPGLAARLTTEVLAVVDEAIDGAGALLDDGSRPTLVHGDVWEGNMIVRHEPDGWRIAGLLDPAAQHADPELELAYLEVFDHDRPTLFEAYARHHPLRPGYERRRLVYWLHTALLHVALFEEPFFQTYTARIANEVRTLVRS